MTKFWEQKKTISSRRCVNDVKEKRNLKRTKKKINIFYSYNTASRRSSIFYIETVFRK